MVSIFIGIVLIIVAAVEWFGHVSVVHAIALLTGAIGILVLLYGFLPGHYVRRD